MAYLIRTEGIPTPFPWLPFTILNEGSYTDHHLLFHVLQIPFTYIGDLRVAAKLSAVFFAACAFTAFTFLLWRYRIPVPGFWLVLLFASSGPFLYRMSMPRAPSLSLAFQVFGFHFILQRRYRWLLILSILFVWTYNGFPVLLALTAAGFMVFYLCEKKADLKLLLAVGGGIAFGLVINPYFPRNVMFLYDHIVPKIFAANYATAVGSEWYPYTTWALFIFSPVALLGYVSGILLTNRAEWLRDKSRLFSFLVATLYLLLLFKSRRFIEYFPPAAILFLSFASRNHLRKFLRTRNLIYTSALGIALTLLLTITLRHVRNDVRKEPYTYAYRGGAEWLARNTPEGAIVFHTDWDDFPMLFFFNTHNRYIVGLDADNLRLKDERLFRLWERITLGQVSDPEPFIIHKFDSHYVLTDRFHKDFIKIADNRKRFHKKFSDPYTIVYKLD